MKLRHGIIAVLLVLAHAPAWADVSVLHLQDPIHPITASFLERVLEEADERGDTLLVVEIDTPGGLSDSMKDMIQAILQARTPVCVYVAPGGARAASAGFMILLSADVAAMAPGTNTGSAHPIFGSGDTEEEGKRNFLMQKVENDAAAFARTLAENRGRNVELAEQAVRESLNFTEKEALKDNLIDLIAKDLPDLLGQLEGRTVRRFDATEIVLQVAGQPLIHHEMTARERLLSTIANPGLAFMLMGLGALGLYLEFTHPGLILPGVVGVICLLLFAFSTQILPINWAGLLLMAAALGMFALEVKVTSYGALTAGGILCLMLGGVMLYDTPDIPELRIPLGLLISVSVAVGGITVVLLGLAVRAQGSPVATGHEGLVGTLGTAVSDLTPAGKVFVHGEYWNAVADDPLASGDEVRVVAVEGLCLRVRRVS